MNEFFEKIDSVKHIEIVVNQEFLLVASALYTHILRLHKKVSLVCLDKNIDLKYSFMPWFEKIKKTRTPSAEMSIELSKNALKLYESFKQRNLSLNAKMATAMYGALLSENEGFLKSTLDVNELSMAHELLEFGAEHKLCVEFLHKRVSLSYLRLKSLMLQEMSLENSAKAALFKLSKSQLKASGGRVEDALKIVHEAFGLMYVEVVILLDLDELRVIKIFNKEE